MKKTISIVTLSSFLFTTLSVPWLQAGFWEERNKIVVGAGLAPALSAEVKKNVQVAALPAQLIQNLPALHTQPLNLTSSIPLSIKSKLPNEFSEQHTNLLNALPYEYGNIRKITPGHRLSNRKSKIANQKSRIVLHIQDIHQNFEAQMNIARSIESLLTSFNNRAGDRETRGVGEKNDSVSLSPHLRVSPSRFIVALEAAFEPLKLKRFHAFPKKDTMKIVAEDLLKNNQITGPIYTAFTTTNDLVPYEGIDDQKQYTQNIQAYKDSLSTREQDLQQWQTQSQTLATRKQKIYSHVLNAFDKKIQSYHRGNMSLGEYITTIAMKNKSNPSQNIGLFLQALHLERTLDFTQVEKERTRLIRHLTQRLTKNQIQELITKSLAYRANKINYSDFYSHLLTLCSVSQILLQSSYPEMNKYIQYVLLSDKINAQKLFQELRIQERQTYIALEQTPEEKKLIQTSHHNRLLGKLLNFTLTPEEWVLYKKADIQPPLDLSAYENFYQYAEKRNDSMARNLMAAMQKHQTHTAVMVTGGFHAQGMEKILTDQNITVINFVPKITKVDTTKGAEYLSIFSQNKTPLQKLFEAEKLFVSQPVIGPTPGFKGGFKAACMTHDWPPIRVLQYFLSKPALQKLARITRTNFNTIRGNFKGHAHECSYRRLPNARHQFTHKTVQIGGTEKTMTKIKEFFSFSNWQKVTVSIPLPGALLTNAGHFLHERTWEIPLPKSLVMMMSSQKDGATGDERSSRLYKIRKAILGFRERYHINEMTKLSSIRGYVFHKIIEGVYGDISSDDINKLESYIHEEKEYNEIYIHLRTLIQANGLPADLFAAEEEQKLVALIKSGRYLKRSHQNETIVKKMLEQLKTIKTSKMCAKLHRNIIETMDSSLQNYFQYQVNNESESRGYYFPSIESELKRFGFKTARLFPFHRLLRYTRKSPIYASFKNPAKFKALNDYIRQLNDALSYHSGIRKYWTKVRGGLLLAVREVEFENVGGEKRQGVEIVSYDLNETHFNPEDGEFGRRAVYNKNVLVDTVSVPDAASACDLLIVEAHGKTWRRTMYDKRFEEINRIDRLEDNATLTRAVFLYDTPHEKTQPILSASNPASDQPHDFESLPLLWFQQALPGMVLGAVLGIIFGVWSMDTQWQSVLLLAFGTAAATGLVYTLNHEFLAHWLGYKFFSAGSYRINPMKSWFSKFGMHVYQGQAYSMRTHLVTIMFSQLPMLLGIIGLSLFSLPSVVPVTLAFTTAVLTLGLFVPWQGSDMHMAMGTDNTQSEEPLTVIVPWAQKGAMMWTRGMIGFIPDPIHFIRRLKKQLKISHGRGVLKTFLNFLFYSFVWVKPKKSYEIDAVVDSMIPSKHQELRKKIKNAIQQQEENTMRMGFLTRDSGHLMRSLALLEKLMDNNKLLKKRLRKQFGFSKYRRAAVMALLLSKVGYGHEKIDTLNKNSYRLNKYFAQEILNDLNKNNALRDALGISSSDYHVFAEAVLREGDFGFWTEIDRQRFQDKLDAHVIPDDLGIEKVDLDWPFANGKYDNPLTALVTLATEADVSNHRLQEWQKYHTVIDTVIQTCSHPEVLDLYLEVHALGNKRRLNELTSEAVLQNKRMEFDQKIRDIAAQKINENTEKLRNELKQLRMSPDKIQQIIDKTEQYLASISHKTYMWHLSSYCIQETGVDNTGNLKIIYDVDDTPALGAAANLAHIKSFHSDRLGMLTHQINTNTGSEIMVHVDTQRSDPDMYALIKQAPKSETHVHLRMAVDFEFYIWNWLTVGLNYNDGALKGHEISALQKCEKSLSELEDMRGAEVKEEKINLIKKVQAVRDVTRELAVFVQKCYGQDHTPWPSDKEKLLADAKELLALAQGGNLSQAQQLVMEGLAGRAYLESLSQKPLEMEAIRSNIDLYYQLKFYFRDLFNFKKGALKEFIKHYDVTSQYLYLSGLFEWKAWKRIAMGALRNYKKDSVEYVELRSDMKSKEENLKKIIAIIQAHKKFKAQQKEKNPNGRTPYMGIVFSMVKRNDQDSVNLLKRSESNTDSMESFLSLLKDAAEKRSEVYPESKEIDKNVDVTGEDVLNYVVGVDAAGHENFNPPSLFYEAFQKLQAYNDTAREAGLPGLGATFHVGESFDEVSLESGMRFVWEAVFMQDFKNETLAQIKPLLQRIGHATVLGLDYQSYKGTARQEAVWQRIRQIRFDLELIKNHVPLLACTRESLEDELQSLQEKDPLSQVTYHYDNDKKIIDIITRRGFILDQLIKHDIVIESNPTSNRAIFGESPLKQFVQYQYGQWASEYSGLMRTHGIDSGADNAERLAQKYPEEDVSASNKRKVRVTINSDDPALFGQETPTEEYYRAAVDLGLSQEEILRIIEEGYLSRMGGRTLPNSAEIEQSFDDLKKDLDDRDPNDPPPGAAGSLMTTLMRGLPGTNLQLLMTEASDGPTTLMAAKVKPALQGDALKSYILRKAPKREEFIFSFLLIGLPLVAAFVGGTYFNWWPDVWGNILAGGLMSLISVFTFSWFWHQQVYEVNHAAGRQTITPRPAERDDKLKLTLIGFIFRAVYVGSYFLVWWVLTHIGLLGVYANALAACIAYFPAAWAHAWYNKKALQKGWLVAAKSKEEPVETKFKRGQKVVLPDGNLGVVIEVSFDKKYGLNIKCQDENGDISRFYLDSLNTIFVDNNLPSDSTQKIPNDPFGTRITYGERVSLPMDAIINPKYRSKQQGFSLRGALISKLTKKDYYFRLYEMDDKDIYCFPSIQGRFFLVIVEGSLVSLLKGQDANDFYKKLPKYYEKVEEFVGGDIRKLYRSKNSRSLVQTISKWIDQLDGEGKKHIKKCLPFLKKKDPERHFQVFRNYLLRGLSVSNSFTLAKKENPNSYFTEFQSALNAGLAPKEAFKQVMESGMSEIAVQNWLGKFVSFMCRLGISPLNAIIYFKCTGIVEEFVGVFNRIGKNGFVIAPFMGRFSKTLDKSSNYKTPLETLDKSSNYKMPSEMLDKSDHAVKSSDYRWIPGFSTPNLLAGVLYFAGINPLAIWSALIPIFILLRVIFVLIHQDRGGPIEISVVSALGLFLPMFLSDFSAPIVIFTLLFPALFHLLYNSLKDHQLKRENIYAWSAEKLAMSLVMEQQGYSDHAAQAINLILSNKQLNLEIEKIDGHRLNSIFENIKFQKAFAYETQKHFGKQLTESDYADMLITLAINGPQQEIKAATLHYLQQCRDNRKTPVIKTIVTKDNKQAVKTMIQAVQNHNRFVQEENHKARMLLIQGDNQIEEKSLAGIKLIPKTNLIQQNSIQRHDLDKILNEWLSAQGIDMQQIALSLALPKGIRLTGLLSDPQSPLNHPLLIVLDKTKAVSLDMQNILHIARQIKQFA